MKHHASWAEFHLPVKAAYSQPIDADYRQLIIMDFIEFALAPEVLACIAIAGALFMGIRSILQLSHKANELYSKLDQIERELNNWQTRICEQRKNLQLLSQQLPPIREKETKIRLYYDRLNELVIEQEKRELEELEKVDEERRRRIHRKKMGYDQL